MLSNGGKNAWNVNLVTIQLLLVGLFVFQTHCTDDANKWATVVARFVIYILTARGVHEACTVAYSAWSSQTVVVAKLVEQYRLSWLAYGTGAAVLVNAPQKIYDTDFPLLFAAYLVCQYLIMEQKPSPTINYGTGMACSFFEGYLALVIPSDGARCADLVDKIRSLEDSQGVVFPVKKLLLVITKSLFCPPDMRHFNRPERYDLPQVEACQSPEGLTRDVAGVKNRSYRNTAYRIYWPDKSHPPVYVTAEFATPLHTLRKVLDKRAIYRELCDVDVPAIVQDFCSQVETVIERSDECRGKCELVHFDDTTDSEEYLPLVLLQKVAEIEPDYKEIIARFKSQRERVSASECLLLTEPREAPNVPSTSQ